MDHEFIVIQRALAGRYSLDRKLGRGGMGVVYLGRDIMLDRQIALKVLPWILAAEHSRERFFQEARTVAKLQHPNVVPVYAVEAVEELVLICMAYVDGGTLADRIRERGRLQPAEVTRILRDIALALAYAHRRGIVHRDIKAENILLDRESGRAMLADFGIAQVAAGGVPTAQGQLLGTPHYMSPEQIAGQPIDGRSDLYSLGIIGYSCLAGLFPFEAESPQGILAQHLTRPAPSLQSSPFAIPPKLAAVIDRCLSKDPSTRYQTGEDLATALDDADEKRGEAPAPLREWVGEGGELTLSQTAFAPLLILGIWSALDFFLNPWFGRIGPRAFDADAGLRVGLLLPFITYCGRRLQLLRRVVANGYRISDVRAALSRYSHQPAVSGPPTGSKLGPVRQLLLGGALALVIKIMFTLPPLPAGAPSPPNTWDDYVFYVVLVTAAGGALIVGAYGVVRRGRRLQWDVRRGIWGSPIGAATAWLAGLGLRRRRTPEFGDRATEFALGSAVLVLFDGLPKALRVRFSELPMAVAELEAVAQRQRVRLEELSAATVPPVEPPSMHATGIEVDRRRSTVSEERQEARGHAERRLRDAVAALESLRLDLLRLHVQGAPIDSITDEIEAALEIGRRVRYEAEAWEVVDGVLQFASGTAATRH
jgi:eukaryotic-like serine/threonine-protein kinase